MRRRYASFARAIFFDRRGTGLSDPVERLPSLDLQMDDLDAVLDAVAVERVALIGAVEAGLRPMYAATHPVTGDRLLSLYAPEAQDWGYRPAEVLGYVEAATPARLGDYARRRPWCSRAGQRVRP